MKIENNVPLQEILRTLREAIERDKNYFIKAKNDKSLNSIRKDVDALLVEITQEAKARAEDAITRIEEPLQRMNKWYTMECNNALNNNEYGQHCKKVADAKEKLKKQNYLEYLDAIRIIESANNQVMHLKQAIKEDIINSERRLETIYETIKKEKVKANENFSGNRQKFYLSIGSFIFGFWLIVFKGFMSLQNFADSYHKQRGPMSGYDFPMFFIIWIIDFAGAIVGVLMVFLALGGLILGIPYALGYLYAISKDTSLNNTEKFENEIEALKRRIAVAKQSI